MKFFHAISKLSIFATMSTTSANEENIDFGLYMQSATLKRMRLFQTKSSNVLLAERTLKLSAEKVLPKTYLRNYIDNSLSYDFSIPSVGSYDLFLSTPYDIRLDTTTLKIPTVAPSISWYTTQKPTIIHQPPRPTSYEEGRLMFEYLSQCSGAKLDTENCVTSGAIKLITSGSDIKASLCNALDIDDTTLRFSIASLECSESDVSEAEFNNTIDAFLKMMNNNTCRASLCDTGSAPLDLFYKILFEDAANCAGVNVDIIPQCVMHSLFEIVVKFEETEFKTIHRVLRGSCEKPSSEEISIFTSFWLMDAKESCSKLGVILENRVLEKIASDFVKILGSQHCWSLLDCETDGDTGINMYGDEVDSQNTKNSYPPLNNQLEVNDNVTAEVRRCGFKHGSALPSLRRIELHYYYLIETASEVKIAVVRSIEDIEQSLIAAACKDINSLENIKHDEVQVSAVESGTPDILSSEFGCTAEYSRARSCHIVDATLSLVIVGQPSQHDADLVAESYKKLEELFATVSFEDSNIVHVKYIGNDVSSVVTENDIKNTTVNTSPSQSSSSSAYALLLIATSGVLIAVAALIIGLARMKKREKNQNRPEGKLHDDNSWENDTETSTVVT